MSFSTDFDKFYNLTWGASDNGSYTLTGQGTMDFKDEVFTISGGSSKTLATGNAKYTIGSGIVLKNATLEAWGGAQVIFNGSLSTETNRETPCSFSVYSFDEHHSVLDLRGATIKDSDFVKLEFDELFIMPRCIITMQFQALCISQLLNHGLAVPQVDTNA